VVERLSGEGCRVVVNYRGSADEAKELAERLGSQGNTALAIQADVTVEDDVIEMMSRIDAAWGGLDILVNNVGDFLVRPISRLESPEWHRVIDSNLHSAFYCCRYALPLMRRGNWGRIVNLAWVNAEFAKSAPDTTPYEVSKTGVVTLSKSLAVEEAQHGITVNVVSPGVIDNSRLSREKREEILGEIPLGRFGTADDVAEAVLFFVSERAAYITGSVLTVSGGWHLGRYRYYKESAL
jgi:3-oxoacyl-[acyl-carrier protein] reductase